MKLPKPKLQSIFGPFSGGPGQTFGGRKSFPTAPKVKESYFSRCKRDEEGHCLPGKGGRGGKPKPTSHSPTEQKREEITQEVKQKVEEVVTQLAKKTGQAALSTKDAIKQVSEKIGKASWDKLPPKVRILSTYAWKAFKGLEHLAMQGFSKGQALAVEAAKQRGLPEEKAEQLGKILSFVDLTTAWTVNFPVVTAVTGNPWAGKASSWIPLASMGYIAYSLARNPLKTIQAAANVISGKVKTAHKSLDKEEGLSWLAGELSDRFVRYPDPDWWLALFLSALDQTRDLEMSVKLADEAAEEEVGQQEEKSLEWYLLKSGFTGTKKDKLGRQVCYANGKRVPCVKKPQPPQVQPDKQVTTKPAKARVQEQELSQKALIAKASAYRVDKTIQRYAEEHNEPRMAQALGGESYDDCEPLDIGIKNPDGSFAHGIELKTMVENRNNKITMKASAMARKADWEKENKALFHTIVLDDSEVFAGCKDSDYSKCDESKRRTFYRRGYGSFRVGGMYEVKGGIEELKKLLNTPEDKLPNAARRGE